jgi:hypothetical protein
MAFAPFSAEQHWPSSEGEARSGGATSRYPHSTGAPDSLPVEFVEGWTSGSARQPAASSTNSASSHPLGVEKEAVPAVG